MARGGVVWMEELDSPFYAKHLGGNRLGSKELLNDLIT